MEGSDGDSLVDWIPGQVGRLGPSLLGAVPRVLGREVGEEAQVLTERMTYSSDVWDPSAAPSAPLFSHIPPHLRQEASPEFIVNHKIFGDKTVYFKCSLQMMKLSLKGK